MKHAAWVGLIASLALAGCLGGSGDDARAWMAEVQPAPAGALPALNPPPGYQPKPYVGSDVDIDPFSEKRLGELHAKRLALLQEQSRQGRSPLLVESIADMRYVGSMRMSGRQEGLIRVAGKVYPVSVGQVVGPSGGRVSQITDREIVVVEREIVGSRQSIKTSRIPLDGSVQ